MGHQPVIAGRFAALSLALFGLGLTILAGCDESSKPTSELAKDVQKGNQANAPTIPDNLKGRGMMRGNRGSSAGTAAVQAPLLDKNGKKTTQ